jgi:hypothetical protein
MLFLRGNRSSLLVPLFDVKSLPFVEILGPQTFLFLFCSAELIRDLKMSTALTSAQREVIERQQFQPLPETERQWVKFHPKEDTPTIENPKASEVLWPAQFDSTYYKKAGFVYKAPVNIAEIHLESKSSILRACKRFGVKNYGFWSREPLKMFRRWFQNEVAGNINILTKGLKPMGHGENLPQMAKDCRKQRRTQLLGHRLRRKNDRPLATIKRHLEKRRSFGERGRGTKPKRKCAVNGCSLEFEHEGLHLVL